MHHDLGDIWVYLGTQPLFWLTLTLLTYQFVFAVWMKCRQFPLLNPVLMSIFLIATLLHYSGVEYRRYFDGAQFIHFLLGPATVALAVPLYHQWRRLRESWLAVGVGLLTGSIVAMGSVMLIAWGFGASKATILSLMPKSATTPIAMAISEAAGGLPTLTVVAVILTGVLGGAFGVGLLRALSVRSDIAIGVAIGTASHGVGTARAFAVSETAGAFSGLSMGLNGLVTAVLAPLIVWLLF